MQGEVETVLAKNWMLLPIGARLAILLVVGGAAITFGIDDMRRPHRRTRGAFLLLLGAVMVLLFIGTLFSD